MLGKISVIIPTYNRRQTLPRAIGSVLKQTWSQWELIVVDDGSTDGTEDLLTQYSDPRLRVLRQDNRGVSAARNFAVTQASGHWLAFLDSDDEWLPTKLESQVQRIAQDPSLRWVHTEEIWVRNGRRVNPMKKHSKAGGDVFANSLKLCCVSPSSVLLQKSLFAEMGGFREDFPVCEDYDLWLKISSRYPVGYVEEPQLIKYGGHADQLSRRFFAMDYWRVLAMANCWQIDITVEQRQLIAQEMLNKCQVLLKGYRRHSNLQTYDFIFHQMKKAESVNSASLSLENF